MEQFLDHVQTGAKGEQPDVISIIPDGTLRINS